MAVRYAAIPAVAILALTGCGSAQTSAPAASLESASQSGAVASADACPANSPVRGILKGDMSALSYNGVFGQVYNNTGSTVWIWSQDKADTAPCRLSPGEGASFGSASEPRMTSDAAWVPSGDSRFWLLLTSAQDPNSPGTAVAVYDPPVGYPDAVSVYRTAGGGICDSDNVQLKTAGLSEGQEYRLKGNSQGSVLVKRLDDNEGIAREWMQTSDADDWARIDLFVESVGRC